MNIFRTSYQGHVESADVSLVVEKSGSVLTFTSVYQLTEGDEYDGLRWTKDGVEYGKIHSCSFDITSLSSDPQWGDVASWHVYASPKKSLYLDNLHAETFASKSTSGTYANAYRTLPVAVIFVPWANSTIDDVAVLVNNAADQALILGDGITVTNFNGSPAQWRSSQMPSMAMTGPTSVAADGSAQFSVSVYRGGSLATDCASEVCLETTGGYLPLQRVRCQAGVATFKLHANHMTAGDAFKVKAGFRNYSGMASKSLTVS